MPAIESASVLIMATDGFEQSELFVPLEELKKAGAEVRVAAPEGGTITAWDKDNWGKTLGADMKISDVDVDDFHALVLPGGQINPDLLRVRDDAVQLVRDFVSRGKVLAAICHAPWLLIEAGVVKGRTMTCYKSIRTDLTNAGADVVDEAVAVSDGIITSRNPDDLTAFVTKIIEEIEEDGHQRAAA